MEEEIRETDFGFVYLDVDHPPIAWLVYRGLLNSADITTANPAQISWFLIDVLKRGLNSTLRREGILEGFRAKHFSQSISRLKCVYAYPTLEAAQRGDFGKGKFRTENLVAIAPAIEHVKKETHDSNWITNFDSLPIDTAIKYWRGEQTKSPHPEALLSGRFFILGTTVRKRAYETIRRTWPNALALLELSRLAVEFDSDFGSISPWIIQSGEKKLIGHIFRYDAQEGPEILRRAMHEAKKNHQFQVNWADLEPFRKPLEDCAADERFKVPDCRPYEHELRTEKVDELSSFFNQIIRASNKQAYPVGWISEA